MQKSIAYDSVLIFNAAISFTFKIHNRCILNGVLPNKITIFNLKLIAFHCYYIECI